MPKGIQGAGVLDANNHQGKFRQDYIRALASAAGLLVYTPDLDHDGVDLLIRWPGRAGAAASPAIDAQVKSWSNPRKSGGTWRFGGLDEVQFNQLAGRAFTVPRYLFLVIVPPDARTYSEILTDGMLLRHQAPAVGKTACTQSTLRLAGQARKYGLGLVFATQSPGGLHNQIPGNATTQVFGLLNSGTQINRARELARVKGGDVPDIGLLRAGEFYLVTEGRAFEKIRTPMCLSHHPPSPLTEEEVIARA